MRFPDTLPAWLEFIESRHTKAIDLGLDRVGAVLSRMDFRRECPVITVGGTNGKGSTCAILESILHSAGYRVCLYSSPHLLRYNERVRIACREVSDADLCAAFRAVETARGSVSLTYFEYGTLGALWLFGRSSPDVMILEVGLGGRLDAVNVLDADCAVITSVDLDHVDMLGGTRELIGREKAGIFRSGKPAVVALPSPPASVIDAAASCGARLLLLSRDFGYDRESNQWWSYWGPAGARHGMAYPALRGKLQLRNASGALCALDSLRGVLPVSMSEVRSGLANVTLPGRFQVVPGRPQIILDVGHNPEAARGLRENLANSQYAPSTRAVIGMMRDKDMRGVVSELAQVVDAWHLTALPGTRAAKPELLADIVRELAPGVPWHIHAHPVEALAAARLEAQPDDKILVFGSFLTVGAVLAELDLKRGVCDG
jgi:dihydrofolate synthase/folylpolyglutamate synthase